jgi:hypothetical protein
MEKLIEEVTIGGMLVQLTHDDVPIGNVELDKNNPRIRYRLQLEQNGKSLEDVILAMPEVKALRKDIAKNGGLRERVILQRNGNGKFMTIEGNCRMVCVESLHKTDPNEPIWKKVPARILPKDVDPRQVAIMLADFHVAGKISWKAHEKAGQVHYMANELNMTHDDIATYLRSSKTTIGRWLHAYGLMVDRFLKIDDDKYAKEGERKWSYFEEFFKQKELRDMLAKDTEFGDDFCRWVGDGRLPEGADVRVLPSILKHPQAAKKFREGPIQTALADAKKLVDAAEPEQGSDFFKLLAKTREACTNAAQVREILRIRTDKVARQRLLDTYIAMVDFMHLADVDIPEAK